MGFYLEFIHKAALIHYQSATLAQETLIDALQECLAQRVTEIHVELPADDAQLIGIKDILLKLHGILSKRGQALSIVNELGAPQSEMQKELKRLGCSFTQRAASVDERPELIEAKKEVKVIRERRRQLSAKEKAQKMLEELKAKEGRELLFNLDFKKIYKDADFQIFKDMESKFLEVKTQLEVELRLKEQLEREKTFYLSRISQLKSITDGALNLEGLSEAEKSYFEKQLSQIDQLRLAKKPRTKLNMGEEKRKSELESDRLQLLSELSALRKEIIK